MGAFQGAFAGGMPDAYAQGIAHMAAHPAAAAAVAAAHMGRGDIGGAPGQQRPDARLLSMLSSRDPGSPMMMGSNMLLRPPPPFPRGGRSSRGGAP